MGENDDLLNYPVLVLNKLFMTLKITTVKHAFVLLYKGNAEVVDKENGSYVLYKFEDWVKVNGNTNGPYIKTPRYSLSLPKIIRLRSDAKPHLKTVKLSKKNVFIRDHYTCQYCGKSYPHNKLTIDHVIPRSRGGNTTWENVVTACHYCNIKKGDKHPSEVHMQLLKKPTRPDGITFAKNLKIPPTYVGYWKDFVI
ncbi:MAG: HNH endonuclease [Planctomycetota bacterium]